MKMQSIKYIVLYTGFMLCIFGCEAVAELFHGPKPEDPPVTYTVTFYANGATGTPPETQTVETGTVINLPDKGNLISTGNIFVGWNFNSNGTGTTYSVGSSVTVDRNMVFYAQWFDSSTPQYTITFNANGAISGSPPQYQTVYQGISVTIPSHGTLVNIGKSFGGWNTQANGNGTNYLTGAIYTVNDDVTLFARWQSEVQYTVTYHANGASGTVPSAQIVDHGTVITIPGAGNMIYSGRVFDGWNTQTNGGGINYTVGALFTVTGNVNLYAKWQNQYTVTYHANGASGTVPSAQTVDPETIISLPGVGNMVYTGRIFDGWNTNASGTGINYESGTIYTVTGNITLYAKWDVIPIVPPGDTLVEKLAYINNSGGQNIIYDIIISNNEFIGETTISTKGSNITVILRSTNSENIRYIQLDSPGFLFTVENNITLKLQDIELRGLSNNTRVLISLQQESKLTMNSGSRITMNTNGAANGGGGVYVNGGTLEINDGAEIIRNTTEAGIGGGGVWVGNNGIVTMNGGLISENSTRTTVNSSYRGGGIYITGNSTVTMTGGIISKNNSARGGGIYIDGSGSRFIKRTIQGSNTSGIIYGSDESDANNASTGNGHAIFRSFGSIQERNSTVGLNDEITTLTDLGWE